MSPWLFLFGILALAIFVVLVIVMMFAKLWVRAWAADAHVSFRELVGMWLRRVNQDLVVTLRITASKARIDVPSSELETHYLALGGRGKGEQFLPIIVQSVINARNAGLELQSRELEKFQLAGGDVKKVTDSLINAHNAHLDIASSEFEDFFLAGGDVKQVVDALINAHNAQLDVASSEVEAFYLAGGNVRKVVDGFIMGRKAGLDLEIRDLQAFHLAGGDVTAVVDAQINAKKASIPVEMGLLQAQFLAGGNVQKVVRALISAQRAKMQGMELDVDFTKAATIDLAGRDVEDAVHTTVNPKVIDCPSVASGLGKVSGVAQDGIEIRVKARVTVRTNIEKLVGGATEETVVARVGHGIVEAVGSVDSHKKILENPALISEKVLKAGLDSGTAYKILSVDVAEVTIGENIGARLKTSDAMAQEQTNKALTQGNRAKVVEAEAQVPLAIAEAFRAGHLGIMDYYRLRNIQADTSMRQSIGGAGSGGAEGSSAGGSDTSNQ